MALAFSPDSNIILTGSWDHTARLWDAATGMPIGPPLLHHDKLWAVAFSPDGKAILTGGDDNKARLFPMVPELPEDLERIGVWTEVVTGLTLDARGSVQVLDNAAWRSRRERLERLGGPPAPGPRK
jgi:WD40 repeat protein